MERWSALRGISWRCTNERQCLWMGIRPRGEREREMSRHVEDVAEEGERKPFVEASGGFSFGWAGFELLAFCCFASVFGLRLRVLARFSRLESEDEGSSSSDMVSGDLRRLAAERVMGAK